MKLTALNKIIHLLGYGNNNDESLVKELLSENFDNIELTNSFKDELERNIIETGSSYQTKILFKHYLSALDEVFTWTVEMLIKNYEMWSYYNHKITPIDTKTERAATNLEIYLIEAQFLSMMVLEHLEVTIHKYGFNIFELCNELKKQKMLNSIDQYCELSHSILRKNDNTDITPIKWLKSEEALRQLFESLKENGLIQSRETEDIIQHFYLSGTEAKQAQLEPINWLKSKALLAYLIDELTKQPKQSEPFIDSNKKWELVKLHLVVNSKEIARSLRGDLSQSPYPNGSDNIDTILKRLPAH